MWIRVRVNKGHVEHTHIYCHYSNTLVLVGRTWIGPHTPPEQCRRGGAAVITLGEVELQ